MRAAFRSRRAQRPSRGSLTCVLEGAGHLTGRASASKTRVVILHEVVRVIPCSWLASKQRSGEGAAIELVPAWRGVGRAPFPDVADHVVNPVRRHPAVVAGDGGRG